MAIIEQSCSQSTAKCKSDLVMKVALHSSVVVAVVIALGNIALRGL